MKKILIIVADSKYFLSHRMALSTHLRNNGYDVSVATDILNEAHRNLIEEQGIQLFELPSRPASVGFGYSIKFIACIIKLCKRIKPDIILSVSIRISFLSMIARFVNPFAKCCHYSLITGLGFLATSTSYLYMLVRFSVMNIIKIISFSRNFYIIVQNQDDYTDLLNVISEKRIFIVLGSGVDIKKFHPVSRDSHNDSIVVTMVSRMLKDKGVEDLVNAAKLIKERSKVHLIVQLVGQIDNFNPNSFSKLQLQQWHDTGNVNWLGPQSDIVSIYQNTDIAVLPSYREGLPKSLLEAASCGLAIIATDTPGCREICVNGENGLLVKPKDPVSLAASIIKLAEDVYLRRKMGKVSRVMVEDKFSLNIINTRMLEILSISSSCDYINSEKLISRIDK